MLRISTPKRRKPGESRRASREFLPRPYATDGRSITTLGGSAPHVARLQALRALDDVVRDWLAFRKGLEALALNGRVMDEHVLPVVLRNEAEAFRVVEPLYLAVWHG